MRQLKQIILNLKFFLLDYWDLEIGDKKLSPPTSREKELIEEFRRKMKVLQHSASAGNSWADFITKMKLYSKYFDPRNFLHWEVIKLTMTMADCPPNALEEMASSSYWEKSFKQAVIDHPLGNHPAHPILSNSSGTSLVHAWHLYNLKKETGINFEELDLIVEFGGGYGNMLKLIRNLGFKGNYVIYDLSAFSLLQNFYLQNIGFKTTFNKFSDNETDQNILIDNLDDFENILKNITRKQNLFIATWSISETPLELRKIFFDKAGQYNYYLFGYQEEFDEINNVKYFVDFSANNKNIQWIDRINHWQGHYLFGKK
ncbi:MAG: hypothetical protein AUJ23_01140 [Candidatus Magasanikbacteria bacterium CG1_02_32_51]|uniref:Sugar O-methyltransferase n=1 Tax=Candidatus Magasanikbacteria bacterium CG1_02_32_51 TaxID=1805238 RepID=A0A1J4U5M4_9BACT|nr:MAG: hypothetical protein AUJ23_01140 [Candidatus Magasanikbacteria bacterium CG1_02_32_51]